MSEKVITLEDRDREVVYPIGVGGNILNSEWFSVSFNKGFGSRTITTKNGGVYTFTENASGSGIKVESSNRVINVMRQNISFQTNNYPESELGLGVGFVEPNSRSWNRVFGDIYNGNAQNKREGWYDTDTNQSYTTILKIPGANSGIQNITTWAEYIRKTPLVWDIYVTYQMSGVAGYADFQAQVQADDQAIPPGLYLRGHSGRVTTAHLTVDVLEELQ